MTIGRTLWNQRIAARDGIELSADVVLPEGQGPFPSVVLRTPYVRGRPLANPKSWIRLVDYGYALVTVDMRGRNDSAGEWRPFVKDTADAHDVIAWAAAQPWCTGRIGMVGGSYEGLSQWWTVAGERPEPLKCIAPLCVGAVQHRLPRAGGIPVQYWLWWMTLVLGRTGQFPGAPSWEAGMMHVPLATLDERLGLSRSAWKRYVTDEIDFSSNDCALKPGDYALIDIPVFIGVGWWDDQETMRAWQALQSAKSAKDCRLLVGAWDHAGNTAPRPVLGGLDVSASVMDTIAYIEQFLALHLKGEHNPMAEAPRCRLFLTGENRWDEAESWPHPEAIEVPMYLGSDGDARGLRGNGRLLDSPRSAAGSDTYIYDPRHPGRDMTSLAVFAWADPPLDYRYLQRRRDTLVYTSEPFREPLMVSGRFRLRVFVSSDRPDTDLYMGICDVHPDGRAIGLAANNEPPNCLRLRYRNGPQAELLERGRVCEITMDGSWAHHVFKPGHRLRLTINSGNFPMMGRNAGTGGHWAEDETLYPQTNTIHHAPEYPSQLLVPVVPGTVR